MNTATITLATLAAAIKAEQDLYTKGTITKEQLNSTLSALRNLFGNDFTARAFELADKA